MLQTHEHQALSDAGGTASAGERVSCLFDAGQELSINVGSDEICIQTSGFCLSNSVCKL